MKSLKSKRTTTLPGDRKVQAGCLWWNRSYREDGHRSGCTSVKSVAQQPGNMIHMSATYHLPFSYGLFLNGDPFLPLFHQYLSRAWCNILCLRDKPAKSMDGMKNVAADCCAHSTFSASLISASFIVMTATGVQKVPSDQKYLHTALLEGKGN